MFEFISLVSYPRVSEVQSVSFFACREETANLVSCVFVFFVDILVRNFPDREATDAKRMSTKNAKRHESTRTEPRMRRSVPCVFLSALIRVIRGLSVFCLVAH